MDSDQPQFSGMESEGDLIELNSQTNDSDEYYDERGEPYIPSPKKSQIEIVAESRASSTSQFENTQYEKSEPYEKSEYSTASKSVGLIDERFKKLNTSNDNEGYNQVSQWVNRDVVGSSVGKTSSTKSIQSQMSDSQNSRQAKTGSGGENQSYGKPASPSGKSKGSTERLSINSSKSSQVSLIERINRADAIPLVTKFNSRNELSQHDSDSARDVNSTPHKSEHSHNSPVQEPMRKMGDLHRVGSDVALSMNRYGSMQSIPEHEPPQSEVYQQSEVYPQSDVYQQSEGYSIDYQPHFKDSILSGSGLGTDREGYRKGRVRGSEDQGSSFSLATSSAFITAVEKGDSTFVRKALENPNMDPNKKTQFQNKTALHLAAGYGQLKVCEDLLYAGVDPASKSVDDRTPLHEAAQGGHDKVLQLLLDYTRNVDAQDKIGRSACHVAAYHGEVDCLDILVEKGGQLVQKDNAGRQTAHLAAMRNHRNILEYLYDKGIDLSCKDQTGKLPIHYAAQYGALDCLTCLVERECDITLPDDSGNLPVHFAARNDHLDCMRFLIKQGTSLEVTQNQERTAAHIAAAQGSHRVLHWLCEKGCNTGAQDKNRNLPIHLAGQNGKAKSFNCLLQHDSDLTAENDKYETPLDCAKKMGHKLAIEKAMNNENPCPLCKQQYEYEEWEEMTAPPPVVRTVTNMAATAFTSPLPKQEKVKTPIEISAEKRKKMLKKKKSVREAEMSSKSIFSLQYNGDFSLKKLPKRDLPAKFFGNYLPSIH